MTRPRADFIVVGSGPAGAAAADALLRRGSSVLMLEAGTPPDPDRFAVMDRTVLGEIPWSFPPVPLEMVGDDIELNTFAIRKVGGSSLAWGAITPRFLPGDFQLRSRYGIAADWPISYDDLEPHYDQAERFLGVSGDASDPHTPPRSGPFPMAAFPMNASDLLVKAACERLGISLGSVPVARNSVPYDRRSACTYYGTCRACPTGAMFGSDRVVTRLQRNPRFELLTQAEVQRVELDPNGRARRVVWLDQDDREQAADGDHVVLAVQCIEAVRILLASTSSRFPRGLANNNGRLGKGFMEHPKFYMTGRVAARLDPYKQGFETATSLQFHDHAHRGEYSGARLLVREDAGPSPALVAQQSGLWGAELRREIVSTFGHWVTLGAFLEQLPHDENRVSLSPRLRGRGGSPAARLDFRLVRDYERRGFVETQTVMRRIFAALDARDVTIAMQPSNSGHYMGGHAMGLDPATSVTSPDLEAHEVPGLFLATAGAFPTSGISNPTLTTVALVLRMVDRLAHR